MNAQPKEQNVQNNTINFPAQAAAPKLQMTQDELQSIIANAVAQAMAAAKPAPKQRAPRTASPYKSNGVKKAQSAEPLYSADEFQRLANYFLEHGGRHKYRNYMMVVFGCTIGDRGSDLLRARIGDVLNEDGTVKDYYDVYEQKTGKYNRNKITAGAKKAIEMYIEHLNGNYTMSDYLIKSQKSDNGGQMSLHQMWDILKKGAKAAGLTQNVATHTLRKTYGYTARKTMNNDSVMDILQAKYKHSDQRVTKTYLTITQGEINAMADSIDSALNG